MMIKFKLTIEPKCILNVLQQTFPTAGKC